MRSHVPPGQSSGSTATPAVTFGNSEHHARQAAAAAGGGVEGQQRVAPPGQLRRQHADGAPQFQPPGGYRARGRATRVAAYLAASYGLPAKSHGSGERAYFASK